jgi:hypothetical protein
MRRVRRSYGRGKLGAGAGESAAPRGPPGCRPTGHGQEIENGGERQATAISSVHARCLRRRRVRVARRADRARRRRPRPPRKTTRRPENPMAVAASSRRPMARSSPTPEGLKASGTGPVQTVIAFPPTGPIGARRPVRPTGVAKLDRVAGDRSRRHSGNRAPAGLCPKPSLPTGTDSITYTGKLKSPEKYRKSLPRFDFCLDRGGVQG